MSAVGVKKLTIVQVAAEKYPSVAGGPCPGHLVNALFKDAGRYADSYVFLPYHQNPLTKWRSVSTAIESLMVPVGEEKLEVKVVQFGENGFAIDHPYFDFNEIKKREDLKDELKAEPRFYYHPDPFDLKRSVLFCFAVLCAMEKLEIRPDILSLHDWFTGLTALYARRFYQKSGFFDEAKIIFTLYDIDYLGNFPGKFFGETKLGWDLFTPEVLEYNEKVCLLKAGFQADLVLTRDWEYLKAIKREGRGELGAFMRRLFEEGRLAAPIRELSPWPPDRIAGIRGKDAREIAEGYLSAYSYLLDNDAWRDSDIDPPLKIFRKTEAQQLAEINPWFAEQFRACYGMSRRAHDRVRDLIRLVGGLNVFGRINTTHELNLILKDVGLLEKTGFDALAEAQKTVVRHKPISSSEVSLVREFKSLPRHDDDKYLRYVAVGEENLDHLAIVTLAGGHDSKFFPGDQRYLNRGLLPIGNYDSLFALHAENIGKLQRRKNIKIPWSILLSPLAEKQISEHFEKAAYFEEYGLSEQQIGFIVGEGVVPALQRSDSGTKILMHEDGKRISLFSLGSGYLYRYFTAEKLLALEEAEKSQMFVFPVGSLMPLEGPTFRALLGYQKQENFPLVAPVVRQGRGPLVVKEGGRARAFDRYLLDESTILKEAEDLGLPVLNGSFFVDIKTLGDTEERSLPWRAQRKKIAPDCFVPVKTLVDLTGLIDTRFLEIPSMFSNYLSFLAEASRVFSGYLSAQTREERIAIFLAARRYEGK